MQATYDTNSSFNYDGSMKDHVSIDEKRGGISGGGMRTTPTRLDRLVGADHIGSGMNPTEYGSQAPPFAGVYVSKAERTHVFPLRGFGLFCLALPLRHTHAPWGGGV